MVDQRDLAFAIEHYKKRATALDRARIIAGKVDRGTFKLPGTREEREEYAQAMIEGYKALRDAGRLSFPEFLNGAGFFASIVHEHRVIGGDYADELDPISAQIREVERAHGLSEGEFWRTDEGPPEWSELNVQYEAVLERQQVAVLREFGLADLADLLENDPKRFHDLWLRAVDAVDQYLPPRDRLVELINVYRQESLDAEAAGAYHAAAAMRGAVLEGLLLLRCISHPADVERALAALPPRERPRGIPTDWMLGQLIKVSKEAGWLPQLSLDGHEIDAAIYARLVGSLRNMLHPGRRLASPATEVTEEELADAKAALIFLEVVLEGLESS